MTNQNLTRWIWSFVTFCLISVWLSYWTVTMVEQGFTLKHIFLLLPLGVVFFLKLLSRPILAAVGVLSFAFVNPSLLPAIAEIQEFTVRPVDLAFILLFVTVLLKVFVQKQMFISRDFKQFFSSLILFLLYISISVFLVYLSVPRFAVASLVSYLRLMVTAAFALILHLAIQDNKDIQLLFKAWVGLALATLIIGIYEVWTVAREVADIQLMRFGGILGFNSFGLVSGLLVLYSFLKREYCGSSLTWGFLLSFGLLGLVLSKSISSILAVAGSVVLYLFFSKKRHSQRYQFLGLPQRSLMLAIILVFTTVALWALRKPDIIGLTEFSGGSLSQRMMLAYAGLRIFLKHPVFGVGWQVSSTEAYISDPELNAILKSRFAHLPDHYFPEKFSTSVHNMYVQILAELGIIGFILFIYACFRIGSVIVEILRKIPNMSPNRILAQFCAFGLIYLLIWWNTNPLYGGQTETFLAFTFLAILGSMVRLENQKMKRCAGGFFENVS